MCHMSHVMCHMSYVICQMSHVACHMSLYFSLFFVLYSMSWDCVIQISVRSNFLQRMSRNQNWFQLILRFSSNKKMVWQSWRAFFCKIFCTLLHWYSKMCGQHKDRKKIVLQLVTKYFTLFQIITLKPNLNQKQTVLGLSKGNPLRCRKPKKKHVNMFSESKPCIKYWDNGTQVSGCSKWNGGVNFFLTFFSQWECEYREALVMII